MGLQQATGAETLEALETVADCICGRINQIYGGGKQLMRALHAILMHLGRHSDRVWPGRDTIAQKYGMSTSTVSLALRLLRNLIGHKLSGEALASGPGPHEYAAPRRGKRLVATYEVAPLQRFLSPVLVVSFRHYYGRFLTRENPSENAARFARATTGEAATGPAAAGAGSKKGQPDPHPNDDPFGDPLPPTAENSNHSLKSASTRENNVFAGEQAPSVCNVPIEVESGPSGAKPTNKTGEATTRNEKEAKPATAGAFLGAKMIPTKTGNEGRQTASNTKISLPSGTGPGWAALCKLKNKAGKPMSPWEATKIVAKHGERCAYLLVWLTKRAERAGDIASGPVEYAIGISRDWAPGKPEYSDNLENEVKSLRKNDATYRALCEAEARGVAWHQVDAAPPKATEPKRAPLPERANLEENPAWLALSPPQRERIALEAQSNVLADVGHAQRPIVQKRGIQHPRVQARILEILTENNQHCQENSQS